MPVPNGKNETNSYKKQRRWSLIGILSKKKKLKKSQESVDFCPYDGKINQKVAQNDHLKPSTDCLIEQYTCSPRLIRRCNSLQYTDKVSAYSNIIAGQPSALNEWKSSQQSVYSSGSSACYSDIGAYNRNIGNGDRPAAAAAYYYNIDEENDEQTFPVSPSNVAPSRCSSEVGHYRNKNMNYQNNNRKRYDAIAVSPKRPAGKKIPPPPPPRDPNVKAVYYFRNNRLVSRESDSTYFSQGSDDNISDNGKCHETEMDERKNECDVANKPGPRSRRPIQYCDVKTLSTESEKPKPCKTQSVEEALQELENIYNSLGLSDDEDLLDRAERRDLPTSHQNMRYQSSDGLDCVTVKRVLPKTRRSGVPDIVADDMAYRRLNRRESKRQSFVPGSFLLVLPTVYNLDTGPRPPGEPDITLDDVVFRSRRQNLNFLKIPDRQPPFGIPLGPIVGAAPSDYLHAVPEGRYKPSFHPRRVPDTVEDDLAFRSLRKDNKYKACFDFSFVHRNRFCKIDDMVPRTADCGNGNKIIKNDTHWIIEKTKFADRSNNNADRVKLLFDDSAVAAVAAADNGQNLMVVKINHHKPIMLSGFTLDEADRLSKSFFRTNLLQQHEPRNNNNVRLTKRDARTTTTPDCAPQSINNNNNNNNSNNNCSSIRAPYKNALTSAVPAATVKRHGRVQFGNVIGGHPDDDDVVVVVGKNQPNFRELIEREYAHRTSSPLTLTEYRPQLSDRRTGPACGDRVPPAAAAVADNGINTIESRNNDDDNNSDDDNNNTTATTTVTTITTATGGGAIIAFGPKTGHDYVGLSSSSPTPIVEDRDPSSLAEYPNRATAATIFPGYTEDDKDVNVT